MKKKIQTIVKDELTQLIDRLTTSTQSGVKIDFLPSSLIIQDGDHYLLTVNTEVVGMGPSVEEVFKMFINGEFRPLPPNYQAHWWYEWLVQRFDKAMGEQDLKWVSLLGYMLESGEPCRDLWMKYPLVFDWWYMETEEKEYLEDLLSPHTSMHFIRSSIPGHEYTIETYDLYPDVLPDYVVESAYKGAYILFMESMGQKDLFSDTPDKNVVLRGVLRNGVLTPTKDRPRLEEGEEYVTAIPYFGTGSSNICYTIDGKAYKYNVIEQWIAM